MNLLFRSGLAITALTALTLYAEAATMTWLISGSIDNIVDGLEGDTPDIAFQVGDTFTHQFTIDDASPLVANSANGSDYNAIVDSTFSISSRGFSIAWDNSSRIQISNYFSPSLDEWRMDGNRSDMIGPVPEIVTNVPFSGLILDMEIPESILGNINPPPMLQFDPTWQLDRYELEWYHGGSGKYYEVNLVIDNIQSVPEPSSLVTIAIGAVGLSFRRKR